jgi:hypothetical protein
MAQTSHVSVMCSRKRVAASKHTYLNIRLTESVSVYIQQTGQAEYVDVKRGPNEELHEF